MSGQPLARRRRVREADLATAWEERRYAPASLVDSLGRPLRVVFPGRRWGGVGPDFRGAVLALADGALLRGDVEVHVRASDWTRHGHATDPAYAYVVLHVVQVADAPARDARGRPLPTLALRVEPGQRPVRLPAPCIHRLEDVVRVVEEAGRVRFRGKAARFEGDLACVEPSQALWRGIAEGLGYAANQAPFARLADTATWAAAARTAEELGSTGVSALLLGTGGLLGDATAAELACWQVLVDDHGAGQALAPTAWRRGGIRPANDPARRCRGLAHLAARWAEAARRQGWCLAELAVEAVRAALPARRPSLTAFVQVAPWIGQGRARAIAVNVLLPFACASGLDEAASLYERLPGEPWNRASAYMASLLVPDRAIRLRTACQQQGLLHLFRTACQARQCERCPAALPLRPSARAG